MDQITILKVKSKHVQVAALAYKVLPEKCLRGTMTTWLLSTLPYVQSRVI